jgi:hypothetical protein
MRSVRQVFADAPFFCTVKVRRRRLDAPYKLEAISIPQRKRDKSRIPVDYWQAGPNGDEKALGSRWLSQPLWKDKQRKILPLQALKLSFHILPRLQTEFADQEIQHLPLMLIDSVTHRPIGIVLWLPTRRAVNRQGLSRPL